MKGLMHRFNDWLAVKITQGMATMWCAYAFLLWSLIPIVWSEAQSAVFYVSGGIIQLVALSLIMVGQNVIGQVSERQAKVTHDTVIETRDMVMEELWIVKEELALACEQRQVLEGLLTELHVKNPNVTK